MATVLVLSEEELETGVEAKEAEQEHTPDHWAVHPTMTNFMVSPSHHHQAKKRKKYAQKPREGPGFGPTKLRGLHLPGPGFCHPNPCFTPSPSLMLRTVGVC